MSYSTRYILNQLARGKSIPRGSPDPELIEAASKLSPMDIEQALHKGARADARDGRGATALHVLLEQAQLPRNKNNPAVLACARALIRGNANVQERHPQTGMSALAVAGEMGDSSFAAPWYQLFRTRGDWRRPDGSGKSALEHWQDRAGPALLALLAPAARSPKP